MHTRKLFLSHTTLRLIFIQVESDHKDGKVLPEKTDAFFRVRT